MVRVLGDECHRRRSIRPVPGLVLRTEVTMKGNAFSSLLIRMDKRILGHWITLISIGAAVATATAVTTLHVLCDLGVWP